MNGHLHKVNGQGLSIKSKYISFNNIYHTENKSSIQFKDLNGLNFKCEFKYSTNKHNIKKSNSSIRPNLFHNIDAATMYYVISEFKKLGKFILTIHDAFIINSADELLLFKSYNKGLYQQRNTYISILQNNIESITNKALKIECLNILEILLKRNIDVELLEKEILEAKFSLKEEFSHNG